MPKKKSKTDQEIMRDRLESFSSDLVFLFNQHHMCVIFRFEDIKTIEEGYSVESLIRTLLDGEEVIAPFLTNIDWNKIIKLGDQDE